MTAGRPEPAPGGGPEPFIAGSHDPRGGSPEARGGALAAALESGPRVAAAGALAVAAHRAEVRAGDPLCALDGTIYNLEQITRAAGVDPAGAPVEVLAAAYARLGEELVERLRGDFALLLWDAEAGRGLLARDQLGGRAVFWHADGARLLFASEVRHLLALLPRQPDPDRAALAHWIAVAGMPEDRTLYSGVRRLRAGHLLRFGGSGVELRRYWAPRYRRPLRAPRAELAERLRDAIETAVARRSVDTGAAVMLSGGLDSATVAALAARQPAGRRPLRAYSATFPRHPSIDEAALVERLCGAFGLTSARAVVRGGSVIAGALPYLERWRLPPVSPNLFFWQPLLARAADDGVRVMLDGEGGDELFGLSPALIADRLRRGRLRSARSLVDRIPGANGRPTKGSVRRIMREHGLKAAAPRAFQLAARRRRGDRAYVPDWFTDATARAYLESDDPGGWKRVRGPRWWAHLVDVTTSGSGPALVYDHVRRRAALAGIEARHPLVDVDVIELVLQFPPELAFDARLSRPLLREAMAGLMPDEVRLRPEKSTFDALFHECLAGPDLPVARALLGDPRAELGAFVDLALVRERLLEPEPPERPARLLGWALHTWRLLTAECWLRLQADPGFTQRLRAEQGLREPDCELVETAPAGRA